MSDRRLGIALAGLAVVFWALTFRDGLQAVSLVIALAVSAGAIAVLRRG